MLSHCNLDIIKELCLRELSQASTTNVAFKRQKFSERSATTILLFVLVKNLLLLVALGHGVSEIYKEAADIHTTKEKYQKDYF